jgi:enterochelin esterase-like enzyme
MKAKSLFFVCIQIFFFFCSTTLFAQPAGKVIEQNTIKSAVLNRNVGYSVYLPPDYEGSQRAYPVVYLLHGFSDDNSAWIQFGEINRYADKAIHKGELPPMIIIMPDADSTFYINSYDGKNNYEDFFIKEFIPQVEKLYRIKSQKSYRGIAGLSMGGYGSLIYAFKYPDLFAAAAPLSAGIFDDSTLISMQNEWYNILLGPVFGKNLKGKERLSKTWNENSILGIAEKKSADDLKKVRYWIDCGDDDFLTNGNCMLHLILSKKKVPHEFRVRDGAHTWTYWRTGITDALAFIGESFRR